MGDDRLDFTGAIELSLVFVEHVGVAVICIGGIIAIGLAWRDTRRIPNVGFYNFYRRHLGRAIILGLEILVASDIIRTVSHAPQLIDVLTLGIIVIIRSFLSWVLDRELKGQRLDAAESAQSVARPGG